MTTLKDTISTVLAVTKAKSEQVVETTLGKWTYCFESKRISLDSKGEHYDEVVGVNHPLYGLGQTLLKVQNVVLINGTRFVAYKGENGDIQFFLYRSTSQLVNHTPHITL